MALLYNTVDLPLILAAVQAGRTAASGADRTQFTNIQNALNGWQNAPVAPEARQQGDPDTRVIVLSYSGVSKANVIALFNKYVNSVPSLRPYLKDAKSSAIDNWTGV